MRRKIRILDIFRLLETLVMEKIFLNIINNKMKLGKACDSYQLCVEHIRYCSNKAHSSFIKLINRIISNTQFLSCHQVKVGLATNVYKDKNKAINKANSYCHLTVMPYNGVVLERYIKQILRPSQSPDQNGFKSVH